MARRTPFEKIIAVGLLAAGANACGGTSLRHGGSGGADDDASGGARDTSGGSAGLAVVQGGRSNGSGGTSVGTGGTSVGTGGTSRGAGGSSVGAGGASGGRSNALGGSFSGGGRGSGGVELSAGEGGEGLGEHQGGSSGNGLGGGGASGDGGASGSGLGGGGASGSGLGGEASGNAGTASPSGGMSGSATGPAPAAVGLSLSLGKPDSALPNLGGRTCNAGTAGGFTYVIGMPNPGRLVEDGSDGVLVSCAVQADGTFTASGSGIDDNGNKPMSFSFSGHVEDVSDSSQNPATMTFFSPDTLALGTFDPFPGCTVGPVVTLAAGTIFTDIDCPVIVSSDDTTSGCRVRGTLAFENCETAVETP